MKDGGVSLIVPGRNCGDTIGLCLSAAVRLLENPESRLDEILFVDDGSTDDTLRIVQEFPVRLIRGSGAGSGAARNLGWRAAARPLVWFVDADCVAEPDALRLLLPHMEDPGVGGVSGSYGIMNPESLLACLIHEEIIERHRRMPTRVDFLAGFNLLYRRTVLEEVGGFDEQYLKAQDAELSFRVMNAGYELGFEFGSRVKHYHESHWLKYFKTQQEQGYWRVRLHMAYPGHSAGDSYSSALDHIQPPLALMSLAAPLLLFVPLGWPVAPVLFVLLLLVQLPLAIRLVRRLQRPRYLLFAVMSFLRAYWRGVGMVRGMLAYLIHRVRRPARAAS
jgi:cellulose synthase/poly-beta-1,6-N-acetylglucosamine synthase-like glycosyltransferase